MIQAAPTCATRAIPTLMGMACGKSRGGVMKPSLAIVAAVAMLGAGVSASLRPSATPALSAAVAKPRQNVLYGHITSLTRRGGHFEMRFDPAWFLSGVTAHRAAVEDGVIRPGDPVPNDNYIVEEGHRLLTYVVPTSAQATVLTRHGVGPIPATGITVSELAQIVKGRNPKHRQLTEPKAGFWIRIGDRYPSPVLSLDQQYQP
jgi:hypothetical protein